MLLQQQVPPPFWTALKGVGTDIPQQSTHSGSPPLRSVNVGTLLHAVAVVASPPRLTVLDIRNLAGGTPAAIRVLVLTRHVSTPYSSPTVLLLPLRAAPHGHFYPFSRCGGANFVVETIPGIAVATVVT